jgi:Concanavalin A-like lectin/glucanases superfamily
LTGLTIRTLSLLLVPLGLLASACADSPTSPSSASTERTTGTQSGATGTTSTASATKTTTGTTGTQPANDASAGYALRFQATGGGEFGRVRTPIEPNVPLDVGGDFTVEFWMRAEPGVNAGGSCQAGDDGWRDGNVIVDRDLVGAPDNGEWGVSLSGGRIAFGVATTRGSQTICGLIDVADNRWHHVAATRRSADGQLRIYVDGTESAQGSGPTGDASYRDGRDAPLSGLDPLLLLGGPKQEDGQAPPGFDGWIDEFRVSNRVRYTSPFDRPPGPWVTDSDTVALYHFDEGPSGPCSSTVLDSSGHGTHGQCRQGAAGSPTPLYVTETPFTTVRTTQRRPWMDE